MVRNTKKAHLSSVRLSDYQITRLRDIAEKRDKDVSEVIRYAIDLFIDGYLKEPKTKKKQ